MSTRKHRKPRKVANINRRTAIFLAFLLAAVVFLTIMLLSHPVITGIAIVLYFILRAEVRKAHREMRHMSRKARKNGWL